MCAAGGRRLRRRPVEVGPLTKRSQKERRSSWATSHATSGSRSCSASSTGETACLNAGMFQKEVAERVAEGPGSKTYGIPSVPLQSYYDIDYLFTVHEHAFDPPPKVKSGVIRLGAQRHHHPPPWRQPRPLPTCGGSPSENNQRRKTLRNSIKSGGVRRYAHPRALPLCRATQRGRVPRTRCRPFLD